MPSLRSRGIDAHFRWNRLQVLVLIVSDIFHIPCSQSLGPLGPLGSLWGSLGTYGSIQEFLKKLQNFVVLCNQQNL